jgi:uncharacterized protein with gpF-like domain
MEGKVYPADDPVWKTWYPPNGFRCRCRVNALTKGETEGLQVESELPKDSPDKGFDTSPGDWLTQRVK